MTITTTTFVPEGIVMASDSRLIGYKKFENGTIEKFAITDNSQKLFLLSKSRVGISFCFDAFIDNTTTIADFIRIFEISCVHEEDTVDVVTEKLNQYLKDYYPEPNTSFYVAGYKKDEPYVYVLYKDKDNRKIERRNINNKGDITYNAVWNGDFEAVDKLMGKNANAMIDYNIMPLKDAIDYCEFIVELVIKYQRFEVKVATCGGPTDILVITKDYAKFFKHKILKP